MRLTPTRLRALFNLYERGYERPLVALKGTPAVPALRDLVKLGYADTDPETRTSFRITEDGILRLEDPMALVAREVHES